jgi:hypothetical protein
MFMKSLITAVLCLILTLNASAQLRLQNSKLLPKLKNSTTYVAIGGNY